MQLSQATVNTNNNRMTENGKQERFSLRNDGMNVEGALVGPPVSGFLS